MNDGAGWTRPADAFVRQNSLSKGGAARTAGADRLHHSTRQLSSVSFTATASCFSENGFGRKPNLASGGRLRAKASSA